MPKYVHGCGGSPHTIVTSSPIYSNLDGGTPHPTTNNFPADRATHMHKTAAGEAKALLRDEPRDAGRVKSGSYLAPAGKSDSLGVDGRDRGTALRPAVQRGVPSGGAGARDAFNRRASTHEAYASREKRDPGVSMKTWDGRTVRRGKSG
jgi:hypothetical protein